MTSPFTLRQLEYAVAAARTCNFGEAAKLCHVSQPSLSAQLAQLEGVLGQKLFERSAKGVELTPFGAEWIPQAREILGRSRELEELAKAGREPLSGELRLGVIPTVAPFVLPATLPILREKHPEARLYLFEGETSLLLEQLQEGTLDVLLLALEADLGKAETLPLFRDALQLALPATHPLADAESVALDQIPREELLLLQEGHCLSRQVETVCRLSSERAGDDFRASSLVTLVQMVAMGMGVTLLPRIAESSELVRGARIVLKPLAKEAFRTIGLTWRPRSPRRAEFEILGSLLERAAPED